MKLIWSAIVKNEIAIIDRCVGSLLPHVDGAVIVDTGSTDGTRERITNLFAEAGKPIEIYQAPFVNFEQSRNAALMEARNSKMEWDYLLLADADMELKVIDPGWARQLNGGDSYDVRQRAGSLGYFNRRVVGRHAVGWYVGVTHEYLDVESGGTLDGVEFVDHADGFNRPEKFQRDIDLLEKALETETRRGLIERYTFYLANSYFDAKNWVMAAHHYKRRVAMGGYEEERWNSQNHYAHCLGNMGDKNGFVCEMLKAHQMRPRRAEALYDLAKYYRETGDYHVSLVFSEAGMQIPRPNDQLFVNEYVHSHGFKDEFAICAFYDPARRTRGGILCDNLALDRGHNEYYRQQARSNQFWYLRPLKSRVPSFLPKRIEFTPPDGYIAMNPSVTFYNDRLKVLVRTVNYIITPEGVYAVRGTDGSYSRDNPIHTRNFIVGLDHELNSKSSRELLPPIGWPEPKFDLVIGFEDSRLFEWQGDLWTLSTVREQTEHGWCEQVLSLITDQGYGQSTTILPKVRQHEKNWMPWVTGNELRFVYRLGTLLDANGEEISRHEPKLDTSHISGSSQVVMVGNLGLALVHEARHIPGRQTRYYQHRFALLERTGELVRLSPPFTFHDRQIEFAAGLVYLPETRQLVASYGIRDCEAWLATMDADEVLNFIEEGQ